ncbi:MULTISPECIES: lysozyme inhibitor LprI family protein [unclassified Pseudomonas]|uniref:lysozyme inhibitor LprI family protein n=1 Tax=unclassified Pseudomonas TaxID=196821 RepID=UPI00257AF390|nr:MULTISPECIES: lysozyme inhibitor LprI family protein [unclassified Pseudomonas]
MDVPSFSFRTSDSYHFNSSPIVYHQILWKSSTPTSEEYMGLYLFAFGLTTLVAFQPAFAMGEEDYSATFNTCLDESRGTTRDMLSCISAETKLQDTRLNEAYQNTMATFSDPQKAKLKETQRLWIKYRDANCSLYTNATGGTIDALNTASCLLDMTKARADELSRFTEQDPSL